MREIDSIPPTVPSGPLPSGAVLVADGDLEPIDLSIDPGGRMVHVLLGCLEGGHAFGKREHDCPATHSKVDSYRLPDLSLAHTATVPAALAIEYSEGTDQLVLLREDGWIMRLDAKAGTRTSLLPAGRSSFKLALARDGEIGFAFTSGAYATADPGSRTRYVATFSTATGEVKSSVEVPFGLPGLLVPIGEAGVIAEGESVTHEGSRVLRVNGDTGQAGAAVAPPAGILAMISVGEETLIATGLQDDRVFVLDADTLKPKGKIVLPASYTIVDLALDPRRGLLYGLDISASGATIVTFDIKGRRLVSTEWIEHFLGRHLAVDERTGRVAVISDRALMLWTPNT